MSYDAQNRIPSEFRRFGEHVDWFGPIIALRPDRIHVGDRVRVDSWVKLEGGQSLVIGTHVHIASFCHINIGGGEVSLGPYSAYASGAKIIAGSNQPGGQSMSAAAPKVMQRVERSYVRVGAFAFVGAGAILMPGVIVGEHAVIGAGAVVTTDTGVPMGEVWAGVPARKVGERDR